MYNIYGTRSNIPNNYYFTFDKIYEHKADATNQQSNDGIMIGRCVYARDTSEVLMKTSIGYIVIACLDPIGRIQYSEGISHKSEEFNLTDLSNGYTNNGDGIYQISFSNPAKPYGDNFSHYPDIRGMSQEKYLANGKFLFKQYSQPAEQERFLEITDTLAFNSNRHYQFFGEDNIENPILIDGNTTSTKGLYLISQASQKSFQILTDLRCNDEIKDIGNGNVFHRNKTFYREINYLYNSCYAYQDDINITVYYNDTYSQLDLGGKDSTDDSIKGITILEKQANVLQILQKYFGFSFYQFKTDTTSFEKEKSLSVDLIPTLYFRVTDLDIKTSISFENEQNPPKIGDYDITKIEVEIKDLYDENKNKIELKTKISKWYDVDEKYTGYLGDLEPHYENGIRGMYIPNNKEYQKDTLYFDKHGVELTEQPTKQQIDEDLLKEIGEREYFIQKHASIGNLTSEDTKTLVDAINKLNRIIGSTSRYKTEKVCVKTSGEQLSDNELNDIRPIYLKEENTSNNVYDILARLSANLGSLKELSDLENKKKNIFYDNTKPAGEALYELVDDGEYPIGKNSVSIASALEVLDDIIGQGARLNQNNTHTVGENHQEHLSGQGGDERPVKILSNNIIDNIIGLLANIGDLTRVEDEINFDYTEMGDIGTWDETTNKPNKIESVVDALLVLDRIIGKATSLRDFGEEDSVNENEYYQSNNLVEAITKIREALGCPEESIYDNFSKDDTFMEKIQELDKFIGSKANIDLIPHKDVESVEEGFVYTIISTLNQLSHYVGIDSEGFTYHLNRAEKGNFEQENTVTEALHNIDDNIGDLEIRNEQLKDTDDIVQSLNRVAEALGAFKSNIIEEGLVVGDDDKEKETHKNIIEVLKRLIQVGTENRKGLVGGSSDGVYINNEGTVTLDFATAKDDNKPVSASNLIDLIKANDFDLSDMIKKINTLGENYDTLDSLVASGGVGGAGQWQSF